MSLHNSSLVPSLAHFLYVAGNISGYCNFGIKPGTREAVNSSGIGFGGAIAFGRYCAQQIAERDAWDA